MAGKGEVMWKEPEVKARLEKVLRQIAADWTGSGRGFPWAELGRRLGLPRTTAMAAARRIFPDLCPPPDPKRSCKKARHDWSSPTVRADLERRMAGGETAEMIATAYGMSRANVFVVVAKHLPHLSFNRRVPVQRGRAEADMQVAAQRASVKREQRNMGLGTEPLPALAIMARFAHGYRGQQGRIAITALKDEHCRFPIDMPDGRTRFCGDPRHGNSSYCLHHRARCEVAA